MKASVCIAFKNKYELFSSLISSLKNQTFEDFEVIVVDDWSTSKTINMVKKLITDDERFKLFTNSTDMNKPYVDAHNKSYELASGDYLFRIDCDDDITNDYPEYVVNFLDSRLDIDCCCVNIKNISALRLKGNELESINEFNLDNRKFLTLPYVWSNQSSCIRKSSYDKYNPKFELLPSGDFIFWLRENPLL